MISAAAQQIDVSLLEAARTLGARPWRRFVDIELPALTPALLGAGAMSFATSMGPSARRSRWPRRSTCCL